MLSMGKELTFYRWLPPEPHLAERLAKSEYCAYHHLHQMLCAAAHFLPINAPNVIKCPKVGKTFIPFSKRPGPIYNLSGSIDYDLGKGVGSSS